MGRKLLNFNERSEPLKSEITAHYPEYVAAPPLDDPRWHDTSWTSLKNIIGRQFEESSHRHL